MFFIICFHKRTIWKSPITFLLNLPRGKFFYPTYTPLPVYLPTRKLILKKTEIQESLKKYWNVLGKILEKHKMWLVGINGCNFSALVIQLYQDSSRAKSMNFFHWLTSGFWSTLIFLVLSSVIHVRLVDEK